MMNTSLVTLDDAGVRRGGRWLVRGVDLAVHRGEILTLIGPNGSGKSTTAKLILGILSPDEGQVARDPQARIAYVPQKIMIDRNLPLTVNRFMRLTQDLGNAQIEAALARTALAHLADAQVHTLSGGEFQRAMLARAIAQEPDFLVLDEPVQGVDYSGEIALYELIAALRDELGCAIVLVSHDLHVVMAATDQVVCLNGHVCCTGTPDVVASSHEYRQLFGIDADPALALYRHHHDHTHMPDGRIHRAYAHADPQAHVQGGSGDTRVNTTIAKCV